MVRRTGRLARAVQCFFLYHRHYSPIHFGVENRNRLADDDGQIQLDRFLDLLPFTLSDIFSDRFCDALDRFGGHFQAGQDLHLFTAVIEGSLLTHQGVHAAHTGRELGVLNVQFHVGRKLALMTVRAQIVGTRDLYRSQHRQHRLGTLFPILCMMSTRTGQLTLIRSRDLELQQLAQGGCSGLVEGCPQRVLDGFQVGSAVVVPLGEDAAQQLVYFPRNLLMDCNSRFFSCSVHPPLCCSTGRRSQIFSLMLINSSLSLWRRWNSETSCCALRSAVGLGNDLSTVLALTLRVSRNWGS